MSLDTQYVRGADKLQRRIATIRRSVNLPDLTEEISQLLLRRKLDSFEREVDPDGRPWAPLTEGTLRRKERAGYGGKKKLQRTEQLKRAIRLIRGGSGTVYTNTGAGFRIGIANPEIAKYARAQNSGVPGRMPARRFLGIGAADVKAVDGLMRRKGRQIEADVQSTA